MTLKRFLPVKIATIFLLSTALAMDLAKAQAEIQESPSCPFLLLAENRPDGAVRLGMLMGEEVRRAETDASLVPFIDIHDFIQRRFPSLGLHRLMRAAMSSKELAQILGEAACLPFEAEAFHEKIPNARLRAVASFQLLALHSVANALIHASGHQENPLAGWTVVVSRSTATGDVDEASLTSVVAGVISPQNLFKSLASLDADEIYAILEVMRGLARDQIVADRGLQAHDFVRVLN